MSSSSSVIVSAALGAASIAALGLALWRLRSRPPADSCTNSAALSAADPRSSTGAARPTTPSTQGPLIVGVTGASGSGKTSISGEIARRLPASRVVAISSDSYYKSIPAGVDPVDYNFDHPAAIDFELLAEHLAALRRGEDVQVPEYDFRTHQRIPGKTTRVSGGAETSVVIVDGIFVLWARPVASLCDLTVFCVEDPDVCLARRLRRDLRERGRTVDSVLTQYLRHVRDGYLQFVAPMMTSADIIIPRAAENAVAIDMLVRDLQRRRPAPVRNAEVSGALG